MPKRANGEGTISQRKDGRWWARITLPDGRRKAFYGTTRQAVAQQLARALHERQQGLPIAGERQTLGQYLAWWLQTQKAPRLRPRTYVRYAELVRLHVAPHLGAVPLGRLTPQHLADLYARLLASGLSKRSVQFVHAVLRGALRQAVRLRLLAVDPTAAVEAPRPERRLPPVLTAADARALLQAARGHRLEACFVLALTTGMRLGELLALRWRDVDFDAGRVQVRHTLQRVGGQWLFAEPKTAQSRRALRLCGQAVEALRQHRARQAGERLRAGPAWQDYDLVFCRPDGRPLHAPNFGRQYLEPLLRRAGLPRLRPHDLRHACASLLLAQNVHPKVVQELLGHSQISLTLDTYSHVVATLHQEAARQMDALLGAS